MGLMLMRLLPVGPCPHLHHQWHLERCDIAHQTRQRRLDHLDLMVNRIDNRLRRGKPPPEDDTAVPVTTGQEMA